MSIAESLDKIGQDCRIYQKTATTARWIKLSVVTTEIRFSQRALVDTMFIKISSVIYIVAKLTIFSAARVHQVQTKKICTKIKEMGSLLY